MNLDNRMNQVKKNIGGKDHFVGCMNNIVVVAILVYLIKEGVK